MKVLEILRQATSCAEEVNALDQLKKTLSPKDDVFGEDDIEHQWLSLAAHSLGDDDPLNPFPACTPDGVLSCQSDLERFTCYLFERRFSWSEAKKGNLGPLLGTISTERDAVLKSKLNNLLDEFLRWYMHQDISQPLLESLKVTVTHACDMPVVRNQTMIHIMEWLQLHATHPSFHKHFVDVQTLVLFGVCDVWSAVRNTCVTRLGRIASNITLQEMESLFSELAKICLNQGSTWQCVEGALMAISMLLKCFQWIGVLPASTLEEKSTGKSQYYLKIGEQELSQLPEFICSCISSVVYPLLAHPQVSVRDHATKAFSTYLSRCDFKVAVESLKEAVSKLGQDEKMERLKALSFGDCISLPHYAVLQPNYNFMAACQAEGLLSVCLYLIKHVQSGVLLLNWPKYFSTFSLNLMHPASTVRQAASVIFKYIVAKESDNSGLLKLVLQALCANWSIDITDLMECSTKQYHSTVKHEVKSNGQISRQGTFRRQFSVELEKQQSILTLHKIQGVTFQDKQFCQAWEWREGRLFAYELIVKFLIINHIHYLFPSYALLSPKFDGSVSADNAVTLSRKPALPERSVCSKSFSHGSASQNQSLTRSVSERRKQMLQRSSTLAEGTFFKKQFTKHYSYFTNQSKPKHKEKSSVNFATSLLCKARDVDAILKITQSPDQSPKMSIPFPVVSQGHERTKQPPDVMMLLNSALAVSKVLGNQDTSELDWLQNVELQPLSSLLRQMLLQTISCHADGRWEVRRMAQQALPLITECVRWYDMAVLTSLWNDYLQPTASLMSYGLALTMAVSVQHVVRLVHLKDDPPVSWKDPDVCRGITLPIITAVAEGLPKWCGIILSLLERTSVDQLTVVTLEIIMTTQAYLPDLLPQQYEYEVAVLKKILHVFCHAHPLHPLSQLHSLQSSSRIFESPIEGYLSCLSKADCLECPAYQVERYMLTELHQLIPTFLQSCCVQGACSLLPVLLHMLRHYSQDSQITKCLLDGCVIIGKKIYRWMQQSKDHEEKELIHNVQAAVEEITTLVADKESEMATLKLLLDVFLLISDLVQTEKLTVMLSALSSRLEQSGSVDMSNTTHKNSEKEDTTNLVYLSNNISADQNNNGDSSDDDEEDKKHGASQAAESLSLSVSSGSGQMAWPTHVGSPEDQHGSNDGSDSDWDSWDDEQEDQASLYSMVSQFFQKLQEAHKSSLHNTCGQSALVLAICQLDEKDQTVLKKLLINE
ncbi:uncharacterized protein LOC119739556 isoform X2 [Patiria miniata]|uniref:Uncharacterized protein n=1 Tax=Patiria miniata TaxID=46514 RepID=A0A914B3H2_PATMI|nr:uncharacterized protein LOC119739556 isoform X2 [Patiria miniata]